MPRRKGELFVKLQPHDVQGVVGEDSTPYFLLIGNGCEVCVF